MQFLKILFWCLLAFVAALFTYGNWASVPVQLWSNMVADVNLPFLLLVTFLAGLVPTAIWGGAQRWRLRQRLAQSERTVEGLRAAVMPADPMLPPQTPVHASGLPAAVPPAALPAAVPPGGA